MYIGIRNGDIMLMPHKIIHKTAHTHTHMPLFRAHNLMEHMYRLYAHKLSGKPTEKA